MRTAVTERPLDPGALLAEVASDANGASLLFVGTVRETNEGRAVTGIDYSAYVPMAERELERIAHEASERFGTSHVVVEHRIGTLGLGDASVVVVVAHPRRAGAYEASRWVVEELKRRVPIWKREHYADGTRDWVDPTGASAPAAGLPGAHGAAARGAPPEHQDTAGSDEERHRSSAGESVESRHAGRFA